MILFEFGFGEDLVGEREALRFGITPGVGRKPGLAARFFQEALPRPSSLHGNLRQQNTPEMLALDHQAMGPNLHCFRENWLHWG